jgi:hypothetical protein
MENMLSSNLGSTVWFVLAQSVMPIVYMLTGNLTSLCMSLLVNATVYNTAHSQNGAKLALEAMSKRGILKVGTNMFYKSIKVSSITFGRYFLAYAHIANNRYDSDSVTITVYTPKWCLPIIPDDHATSVLPPGHMYQLVNISADPKERAEYRMFTPPVVTRKTSLEAECVSDDIAKIIKDSCANGEGNVFIVSGPPGVGKTYGTRKAAHETGAALCDDFDMRRNETVYSIAENTRRDDQKIVFGLNECDVVFRHPKADKPARNCMMDSFANNPQKLGALVMTTNAPLVEMFRQDPSMLRDGRVRKIEVARDGTVTEITDDVLRARLADV